MDVICVQVCMLGLVLLELSAQPCPGIACLETLLTWPVEWSQLEKVNFSLNLEEPSYCTTYMYLLTCTMWLTYQNILDYLPNFAALLTYRYVPHYSPTDMYRTTHAQICTALLTHRYVQHYLSTSTNNTAWVVVVRRKSQLKEFWQLFGKNSSVHI